MSIIKFDVPKPECRRCGRLVDSASGEPIIDKGQLIGNRLTYACHGETKVCEVMSSWFLELGNDKKPFMPQVFDVVAAKPYSQADIDKSMIQLEARSRRIAVADFVEKTINALIDVSPTFKGDRKKWCLVTGLQLVTRYEQMIDRTHDIRELVAMDGTIYGTFHLPFYPDETEMTFIPFVKPKPTPRAKRVK